MKCLKSPPLMKNLELPSVMKFCDEFSGGVMKNCHLEEGEMQRFSEMRGSSKNHLQSVSWGARENGERKRTKCVQVDFKEVEPGNGPEIEKPNNVI